MSSKTRPTTSSKHQAQQRREHPHARRLSDAGGQERQDEADLRNQAPPSAANNQRAADAVVAAVKAAGLTDRVEYIAFDLATCKRIAAALPDAMVQYLNGDIAPAALRADGIRGIDYTFSTISVRPDWIREAHDNGMVVNTWTVNAEQDMMSCIALGMDFITTNIPRRSKNC